MNKHYKNPDLYITCGMCKILNIFLTLDSIEISGDCVHIFIDIVLDILIYCVKSDLCVSTRPIVKVFLL